MEHQEDVVIEETHVTGTHGGHTTETVHRTGYRDQMARAVAVIGLIAILLLGAWGIIQIAFNLPTLLGEVNSFFAGKPKTESVTLQLPTTATTGQPFAVTWSHNNKGSGSYMYSVAYSCTDGLTMKAPTPNGSLQPATCATPFNYVNANSSMQLTPTVTGTQQVSTTITVSAIALADGSVTATKSGTITILPSRNNTTATRTTTTSRTTTASNTEANGWDALAHSGPTVTENRHYSNPTGVADLAVNITDVLPLSNNLYSVRFVVQNLGTKISPDGWTFAAHLPVGYDYTYNSGPQQALYPGDKIMYSLTFSGAAQTGCVGNSQYYPNNPTNYYSNNAYQYTSNSQYYQYTIPYPYQSQTCYGYNSGSNNIVTVTVDPNNYFIDNNRSNNTATAQAPIGY